MNLDKIILRILVGLGLISLTLNASSESYPVVVGRPVADLDAARSYRSYIPSIFCSVDRCETVEGLSVPFKPSESVTPFFGEDEYTAGRAYSYDEEGNGILGYLRSGVLVFLVIGCVVIIPLISLALPAYGIKHMLNNDKRII